MFSQKQLHLDVRLGFRCASVSQFRLMLLSDRNQSVDLRCKSIDLFLYDRSIGLYPVGSSVTFLYPLKTSENLWFSDVFRGYGNMTLGLNGLMGYEKHSLQITPCKSSFLLKAFQKYFSQNHAIEELAKNILK